MSAVRWVLPALLLVACGWLLHRGLLAMERRGWIYYRRRGRGSAAAGLGALDEVFHPSAQITVVQQEEQRLRGPRRPSPGDPPAERHSSGRGRGHQVSESASRRQPGAEQGGTPH